MPRRRANGEGSIRKRPNGLWECQFMVGYHPDGRRKIKSIYGKTQRELKQKMILFQQEQETKGKPDSRMPFSEWADIWYDSMKGQVTDTTYEGYQYTTKILKEYFKDTPLEDIKALQVEAFLRDMVEQGRSANYIAKLRAMLFQILRKAEANDLIIRNPVSVADKVKANEPPRKMEKDSYTREEVKLLMEKLPDTRIGLSIKLMLGTGMRMQEVLGLEPCHIDPDGSMIHVRQAVTKANGAAQIGPPKSKNSYRDIPVPKFLWKSAKSLRDTNEKYIWHGVKGPITDPSVFRRQYDLELAKIPEVRRLSPHCCRHTYISQMQAVGVDMETIQSLAGHADIEMTEHYLHVQKEVKCSAVDKFNDVFSV